MSQTTHPIVDRLVAQFPDIAFAPAPLMVRAAGGPCGAAEQMCVRVSPDRLLEVMHFLREDQPCCFEQLCDLTCIDYLNFPGASDRFGVIYALLSISHGHRLWLKCFVNDPKPSVPSVTSVWRGAEWLEREVYDMFGITFEGHPDLRRILTWEGFKAHPLRKDYPLRGRGEREDFPVITTESA